LHRVGGWEHIMKAVVYNGSRDVSVKHVPDTRIEQR
jgi:hypothetical protein